MGSRHFNFIFACALFLAVAGRVDNVYGGRHPACPCVGMDAYGEPPSI